MAKKKSQNGGQLALVDDQLWIDTINDNQDMREALEENLMPGETIDTPDLLRISVPSGGQTTWRWEEHGQEKSADEIVGVYAAFQMRGILWPTDDVSDAQPLLVTSDFVAARRIGDDYGDIDQDELERYKVGDNSYDWARLPWTQWGSGKGGVGKRAKEMRDLFILRQGESWPVLVSAPPGSLRDVVRFTKTLKVPHYRCVIALGLEREKSKTGADFAKITPKLLCTLDRATGLLVKACYTEHFRARPVEVKPVAEEFGEPETYEVEPE